MIKYFNIKYILNHYLIFSKFLYTIAFLTNLLKKNMEQQNVQAPSNAYKTFGIISLILGIIAFIFSFIPCLGTFAVIPGILGIILGIVGFVMANKVNGGKGMVIAGIILSILGTAVASWQAKKMSELSKVLQDSTQMNQLKNSMDSLKNQFESLTPVDSVGTADSVNVEDSVAQ